jgi:hypothetical protein
MLPQAAATTVSEAVSRLEALGAKLAGLGWQSRLVVQPGRPPSLHVINPEPGASALNEDVYAAPRDGLLWFWWSWAEPIHDDPTEAASAIVRVLRPAAG